MDRQTSPYHNTSHLKPGIKINHKIPHVIQLQTLLISKEFKLSRIVKPDQSRIINKGETIRSEKITRAKQLDADSGWPIREAVTFIENKPKVSRMEVQVECRICQVVLHPKSRRVIFSNSFLPFQELKDVLGYTPTKSDGGSNYVCYRCMHKLNKLKKISFDIKTKPDALRQEKSTLLSTLRRPKEVRSSHCKLVHLLVSLVLGFILCCLKIFVILDSTVVMAHNPVHDLFSISYFLCCVRVVDCWHLLRYLLMERYNND